jgi:hypothetical protein
MHIDSLIYVIIYLSSYMEPESPLFYSQQATSGHYAEPAESCSYPKLLFLLILIKIIIKFTSSSPECILFFNIFLLSVYNSSDATVRCSKDSFLLPSSLLQEYYVS